MKFTLLKTDKVDVRPGHQEDRYHYQSEDGKINVAFYAGDEPWTWNVKGSASRPVTNLLIDKFCAKGGSSEGTFEERIRVLEV